MRAKKRAQNQDKRATLLGSPKSPPESPRKSLRNKVGIIIILGSSGPVSKTVIIDIKYFPLVMASCRLETRALYLSLDL